MTKNLKGKKILITSYSYASFGGAELNAVELAEQLVQFGMKPTFFSYDIDGPLKEYIEKKFNTKVLKDQIYRLSESEEQIGVTKLDINDYDYIWIGGNTVPISILKQINNTKKLPHFIFIHMSQLIGFPLDAPLMPDFEIKIASKILSISEKTTTDNIQRILGKGVSVRYWQNPVPNEFKILKKRTGNLRKIAVISSSYPSDEIMGIKDILSNQNIQIDYIGKFNNNVKVVNAKFYDQYDLVIGIGKNSRYSLVSGVPVYIYGRFGGGGYINDSNLKLNNIYNFSGRGFDKKDANTIANEIISGYHDALKFHETHRQEFINELSIDNVAGELFSELVKQKNKTVKFEQEYINWLVSMQITLLQRSWLSAWYRKNQDKLDKFGVEIKLLKVENAALEENIGKLSKELKGVYRSRSWKVTKPVRLISHVFKQLRSQL